MGVDLKEVEVAGIVNSYAVGNVEMTSEGKHSHICSGTAV
jgi:hypothetical protein